MPPAPDVRPGSTARTARQVTRTGNGKEAEGGEAEYGDGTGEEGFQVRRSDEFFHGSGDKVDSPDYTV